MDFNWSSEQLALRERVITFAEQNLNTDLVERDSAAHFDRSLWNACAEFGIHGLNVPVEYGGQGYDILTTICAMEALGYGCRENSLPFAIASQMLSVQVALLKFGSEKQKKDYLAPACDGSMIGAFGITEEDSGSDTYALQMSATSTTGGYVLNGRKCYITSAPICDFAIVFASTNPEAGRWGISAFIVDTDTNGFTRTPVRDKMGMRTTQMGDLQFEDCFVPESARLGSEGIGVSMFSKAMEAERGFIFASVVGRMERQLEEAIQFTKNRKSMGEPIIQYQSVGNRLADMKIRLETSRLLLYKVAWLASQNEPVLMEAAMAKLYLSEAFLASSLDWVRISGARGYVTEFGVERDVRDGIGGLFYSGTSEIQRLIITRLLDTEF